jgi:hypothetical protein
MCRLDPAICAIGAPMRLPGLLASVLVLVSAAAVRADDASPCRADVERLCAGVQRGEGRLRSCVRSHLSELSAACREHLEHVEQSFRSGFAPRLILACKVELETLCKDVEPGGGRWRRCLGENTGRLSEPCQRLLESIPAW